MQILCGDGVGRLAVHVDEPISLIDGDKIECCPAQWVSALAEYDDCSGHQKLPASTRILYMADSGFSIQKNVGDKAIGTVQEDRYTNGVVSHERKYSFV